MRIVSKLLLLFALALPAAHAAAQGTAGTSGTIQMGVTEDGFIVIDGKRLVVRTADLEITYKGVPMRASILDAGMTVLYRTRSDGSVSSITLIGPAAILDALQNE